MRKIILRLDSLTVESFPTTVAGGGDGTVAAHQLESGGGTCGRSCPQTCPQSCNGTCYQSCNGTCLGFSCDASCVGTCGPCNHTDDTCLLPCVP
jgi:hypothetical protein